MLAVFTTQCLQAVFATTGTQQLYRPSVACSSPISLARFSVPLIPKTLVDTLPES